MVKSNKLDILEKGIPVDECLIEKFGVAFHRLIISFFEEVGNGTLVSLFSIVSNWPRMFLILMSGLNVNFKQSQNLSLYNGKQMFSGSKTRDLELRCNFPGTLLGKS